MNLRNAKLTDKLLNLEAKVIRLENDVKTYTDLRNRLVEVCFLAALLGLIVVFVRFMGIQA